MNLTQLQPANTTKAKTTAQNVFTRFLDEQHVSMDHVAQAINGDTGETVAAGALPAVKRARGGGSAEEGKLAGALLQDKTNCRDRKASPRCTKEELYSLMRYMYSTATAASDFQDVALLSLLWCVFGRASDLSLLQKQNISITAGSVLFLRFVRVKTSQENGLSLFSDSCAVTCPVTAIAAAMVMQTTPSTALLPNLPAPSRADIAELGPQVPLAAVLAGVTVDFDLLQISPVADQTNGATASKKSSTIGVHGYVNRLLSKFAMPAGVVSALTSHSFRRGGAQAANGCADLTLQWIADRGGWNMSSTNKTFQYIFNTTQEDQKMAKVLSGWDPKAAVPLLDLRSFDALTRGQLDAAKGRLFACCSDLQRTEHNVNPAVTDTLCAYLIKSFPEIKSLNPVSLIVRRVEDALAACGVSYAELLAWAVHLSNEANTTTTTHTTHDTQEMEMLKAQSTFIGELLAVTKTLSSRLKDVEAQLEGGALKRKASGDLQHDNDEPMPLKKQRKSASTNLVDSWYEWFACAAHSSPVIDIKKKSDMRTIIGFMLLFAGDYHLDSSADGFRDHVLDVGQPAAVAIEAFFVQHGITARSTGTAVKAFRKLHQTGQLDNMIVEHQLREHSGLVTNPTPASSRPNVQPLSRR